jgi:glycosyltransferase involved in cell wall biosynthesis
MDNQMGQDSRRSVAFVSSYMPRQCGIATFTQDLCDAMDGVTADDREVIVVALNDLAEGYPYPGRVRFEVRQSVQNDYRLAAEYLNVNLVSAVCLQHEYGLFGGPCGAHVLTMLRRLRRPLVTTLHTVLKTPTEQQRVVLQEIAALSSRLVGMSELSCRILRETYKVPSEKIVMVPHGIPDVPFVDPNYYKDHFGVEGRRVLLTFGLLSPNKGIEYVIDALPAVVRKHQDVAYIVLGATHPQVRREYGEEYRNSLLRRVHELGLAEHVIFQNRFVTLQELCEFLGAADIYISPYVHEAQVVSGTLAYALGAGKAVIATPYWYAAEMLADGRGRLVPFRSAEGISEAILDLLDRETERHAMRKRAYTFCRQMVWPEVAQRYLTVLDEAGGAWARGAKAVVPFLAGRDFQEELPEVDLRHIRRLTDDTGILQHCTYVTPNRDLGYTTDDNARALIALALYWQQSRDDSLIPLMHTYLAFLNHALDFSTGRFRNFMNYDRTWSDHPGGEDAHARAIWALGMAVAYCPQEPMVALATRLFMAALPYTESLISPRAWAFVIIGLHAYLRRFSGDLDVKRRRVVLTERLLHHFHQCMSDDWPWCEDLLAYANARLPHALLMSGKWMQRGEMIDLGLRVLRWLLDIQTNEAGMLSVIGTNGWYPRGGPRAKFDQQPIEAQALVDACAEAYHITNDPAWIGQARKAFNWFLGDNDLRTPLYDFTTGGCRDGLHSDRVNENQGGESTLAWLMSLLLMQQLLTEQNLGAAGHDESVRDFTSAEGRRGPRRRESHVGADRDDQ